MESHQKNTESQHQRSQYVAELNWSLDSAWQPERDQALRSLRVWQGYLSRHWVIHHLCSLCEGGELFDRLDKLGGFSEKDARYLFRQMAESLTYLHGEKIAHRDLKPENFLFMNDKSNELKLIDFGLAYRWETSLKDELQKKGDKKIVGTVNLLWFSLTTWHQRFSPTTMMKDAISGPSESFCMCCFLQFLPSTETTTRKFCSQSKLSNTILTVIIFSFSPWVWPHQQGA